MQEEALEYAEVRGRIRTIEFYTEGDIKHIEHGSQHRGAFSENGNRIGQCIYYLTCLNDGIVAWLEDVTVYSGLDEMVYKPRILRSLIEFLEKSNNPKCTAIYYTVVDEEDKDELKCFRRLGFKKVGKEVLKKELFTRQ